MAGTGKNYSWSEGEKKKMERWLKCWESALNPGKLTTELTGEECAVG